MKPIITIVCESGGFNLGDQAITQALSEYLSNFYDVRLFSLSASGHSMAGSKLLGWKNSKKASLFKRIASLTSVKMRARFRWYLLGERRNYYRSFESEIAQSSAIVIGGGQLVKNNTALFCDRLAVIARVADSRNTPYFFVGVGVDRRMSILTWKIVEYAINGARSIVLRDALSQGRVLYQFPKIKSCHVSHDLAFALGDMGSLPHSRKTEYAINVMNAPLMIGALPKKLKLSVEDIRNMWFSMCVLAVGRGAAPVIFTTGSPEDLLEAQNLQIRLRTEASISLDLVHPGSVDELRSQLSQFRNVLASRMHAGVLAYISGCNTICLNWDDKVKGVWALVKEESRVIEIESLTGPQGGACLQKIFAESRVPTAEKISEVSCTGLVRLRSELSAVI